MRNGIKCLFFIAETLQKLTFKWRNVIKSAFHVISSRVNGVLVIIRILKVS